MTALDAIAFHEPKAVRGLLPKIATADKGSVITGIMPSVFWFKLASLKQYAGTASVAARTVKDLPPNQLPMYSEMAAGVVTEQNRKAFYKILTQRLPGLEKESQKKRVSRVLRGFSFGRTGAMTFFMRHAAVWCSDFPLRILGSTGRLPDQARGAFTAFDFPASGRGIVR